MFLKKGRKYGRPRLSLTHGTVPQEGMNEDLFKTYDQAISTIYQHAKARNEVLGNGATYRGRRQGHKFGRMYAAGFRPGYDRIVKCDATDGVIQMLWNSQIHHQTTASKTFNAQNERIPAGSAEITRFACSCQISQALVNRLNTVQSLQSMMSESEWISYQASVLTGYKEQAHQKMKALAIKYGIWQEDF
ncbi:uncharacterized protein MELLADRAFT_114723 [Melampsora larici-populina 98AG31]|uniref:Uncharacterized protein n=1 Tax=Melampsora larici-populina (strain 98AG31 / pathotype 3-4-7) TaxID=747676 RepID=F4SEI8_MELLP|nr:uncharacterized protein MELLADRAFT_114723 [Melampsora larici-populina 98AG31]EGF96940.1 hypothetical protein MELLADRAFT_114723 [Melampsora larici-populina 98AG31]